jgi:hypothetical protein
LKFERQLKYLYLKIVRLRGDPHHLALGMALGVFSAMLPVLPFQTALAVTLAIFFNGSKIAAAIGTWVTNPLNWGFLYLYTYKIGTWVLGLRGENKVFSSVMQSIQQEESALVILGKILGAGGAIAAAFLTGGLILGITFAPLSYVIFLRFFRLVKKWREQRRQRKQWQKRNL